jgi:putative DNA primase/helicase
VSFRSSTTEISVEIIRAEAESLLNGQRSEGTPRTAEFKEILPLLEPIDFSSAANAKPGGRVPQKVKIVLTVQAVLAKVRELNCGLCRNHDFVYAFNGEFWQRIDRNELERFLGEASERFGVDAITARHYKFKRELLNQFLTDAFLHTPPRSDRVLINLQNGTCEIAADGFRIRDFDPTDFLTYQLPFSYDEAATAPRWRSFLNEVLPDPSKQQVMAEYIGYVFARHLKLEKTLILYGSGANGKSVFFDVINALLGRENVCNLSLEAISKDQYYRALLADKLLNYSSEISGRLLAEKFKQLTSGEPIEARLPYGQPTQLEHYARLAFNCNEMPTDVEHTGAFFRRFLIVTFDVTVPEDKRDPNLAKEIIRAELSGVFNWVLEGLERLLSKNGFSRCEAAQTAIETFKRESDSVAMFIDDERYLPSSGWIPLKDLYPLYRTYCVDNGTPAVSSKKMVRRLEILGYANEKRSIGKVVYVEKE